MPERIYPSGDLPNSLAGYFGGGVPDQKLPSHSKPSFAAFPALPATPANEFSTKTAEAVSSSITIPDNAPSCCAPVPASNWLTSR